MCWFGGGEYIDKIKCKINFFVEIINNKDFLRFVRVGNMIDIDEFLKVFFGIGWSKLVFVKEIEKFYLGFLDENSLFIEIKCVIV